MPEPIRRYVVQVDTGKVYASGGGARAWAAFELMQHPERVTYLTGPVMGCGIAHVACDSEADAREFADAFIDAGAPHTAVKVKAVRDA